MSAKTQWIKIGVLQIVFALALICRAWCQDITATQVFANPLLLNPAIMGANGDLKLVLNYKNQLTSISKGYTVSNLAILYPIFLKEGNQKLDIGFNLQNDKSGAFKQLNMSLALGYDLNLSTSGHLSLAIIGGYNQKTLATSNLTFDEQYINGEFSTNNPITENFFKTKTSYGDVGFGMVYYYNPAKTEKETHLNGYAGLSGFHLNTPDETSISGREYLPRRISFQTGVKIVGEHKIDFTPNMRLNIQGGLQEIIAGTYVDYRASEKIKIVVGGWFRLNGTMAALIGFEQKDFTLGYSYDFYGTSGIGQYQPYANANQITFSYKFHLAEKKAININASPFSAF